MSVVISILIMIFILSILVVVHEWGHFIVARIFKVKVNEFSIFMGPKLFQRTTKKTGMKFSIRALPFGGYCALEGELPDEEEGGETGAPAEANGESDAEVAAEETAESKVSVKDGSGSFFKKPWYIRALVLVAGVTMNYLLALLIVAIIFAFNGYDTRYVSAVSEDAPATIAGIQEGDEVLKFNGMNITTPVDYSLYTYVSVPENTTFTVRKKDGTKLKYGFEKDIKIEANEGTDKEENPGTISTSVNVYSLTGRKFKTRTELGTYTSYWDNNRALTITLRYASGEAVEYFYGTRDGVKGLYVTTWSDYSKPETGTTEMRTGLHETLSDEEYVDAFIEYYNSGSQFTKYGFSFTYSEKGGFFGIIGNSFLYVHSLIKSVFLSIWFLITGKLGLGALSGPIGITGIVNSVVTVQAPASSKFFAIAEMTALISANLAVVNLLPVPGLDGGKLLFIIIELCRGGKKVPAKVENIISMIFFGLLILLAIIVAGNDIVRLFNGSLLG
ncbi:MAG: site-2 protease family protein [Clostridia bacterium]|nr:site-2 protease family protein [Clostridia bacterium]